MKIEPKHIFTQTNKVDMGPKGASLTKTFQAQAPYQQSARPLLNRAQMQKASKENQKLTKAVQSIIAGISTPFIKR